MLQPSISLNPSQSSSNKLRSQCFLLTKSFLHWPSSLCLPWSPSSSIMNLSPLQQKAKLILCMAKLFKMLIHPAKIRPPTLEVHQAKLPRITTSLTPLLYQLQKHQSAATQIWVDLIPALTEEVMIKKIRMEKKRKNISSHLKPQTPNHRNLELPLTMTRMTKTLKKSKVNNLDQNYCGHNKLKVKLQSSEAQDLEKLRKGNDYWWDFTFICLKLLSLQ